MSSSGAAFAPDAADVSIVPRIAYRTPSRAARNEPLRIVLFGTGTVGSAVLERWALAASAQPALQLVALANSRSALVDHAGLGVRGAGHALAAVPGRVDTEVSIAALGRSGTRLVIDATASDSLAARHAHWLAQGIHVVTASKLGSGSSLARWRAIRDASARSGAQYGDSATVGAGLPLLRAIRRLRASGERVHALAGSLSGSLAWLFSRFDGECAFSDLVREARRLGYTEPDPRDDLSGADVTRKLLILSRAAGLELEADAVHSESLLPPAITQLSSAQALDALPQLDAALRQRVDDARSRGCVLRFIARLGDGEARVGLEALVADDPLAAGSGCENRVAIWSDRYRDQPLVIQGAGAGAAVTAAALLDDVLDIASRAPH